jgi:hypothetical protein
MQKILERAKFGLLVLVGDTYQIEAIEFGTGSIPCEASYRNTAIIDGCPPTVKVEGRVDDSVFEEIRKDVWKQGGRK